MGDEAAQWIFGSPGETLCSRRIAALPPGLIGLLLFSALLSASLAETLAISGGGAQALADFVSFAAAFLVWLFLYYELSRLFPRRAASAREWFSAAVLAAMPLHLLLPAALLFHGTSASLLLAYEVFKLVVFLAVIRRSAVAIETLNGWPAWSAALLLIAPFLLAVLGFMVLLIAFFSGILWLATGISR